MAKRFTSTEKWSDPWYRKLSPKHKCLWDWLFTQCDIAGTINPDLELASFQIGESVTDVDLEPFSIRMEKLPSGRYYLKKFIEFQYGVLTECCRAHRPVIALINRLSIPYTNKGDRDKDKEQEQDKDQEQDKEQEKDNTWRNDFNIYLTILNEAFSELIDDAEEMAAQERLNPDTNIKLTLEKAVHNFWGIEAGWKHKKKTKGLDIDMRRTLINAISQRSNKVFKPFQNRKKGVLG